MADNDFALTHQRIAKLLPLVDYSEALTITATEADARAAAREAVAYGFRAAVPFPANLAAVVEEVRGSSVLAQIVVGFPSGADTTRAKRAQAEEGLATGARDLDMVMRIGAFKAQDYKRVAEDIEAVVEVARPFNVPFKVIIETGVLSQQEIVDAAKLVADTGATFIKTCTGFGGGRATIHDIMLIRRAVGDRLKIKASGGVASLEDGLALLQAGADVLAFRGHLVRQLEEVGYPARAEI